VDSPAPLFVRELSQMLPSGSEVIDVGCGGGAFARELAQRHRVTGVDLSAAQIELARGNVPKGTFVCADVLDVDLPPASFDAAVALYVFCHVPRAEHPTLLGKIARWLRPGALLLATMSAGEGGEVVEDWLGVPMFFSSWDVETNRRLVREAGFELLRDEVLAQSEPGHGDVPFLWLVARRL
jgi:cyclopropane fatty-acyl-phospholipid synthase-like methyltransferase